MPVLADGPVIGNIPAAKRDRLPHTRQATIGFDVALDVPLCVDLDGTLLRINSLHEAALPPSGGLACVVPHAGLARRRECAAEAGTGARWQFAPAQLPYSEGVLLHLLEQERARGRRIVSSTAADQHMADALPGISACSTT